MKYLLAFLFTFSSCAGITKIYSTKTNTYIDYNQLQNELPDSGHIVLGEFHNFSQIQNAQAKIIKDKMELSNTYDSTQIMWEFINHTDQENINKTYSQFLSRSIDSDKFTTLIAGDQNIKYSPIIELTKLTNRAPIGLNLPRSIKKKVMDEGIGSIDPELVPEHHYVGGENYLSRFRTAMGGHANEDLIQKYFLAQCLTDSVMSDIANKNHIGLSFIVAGSFHTDFFDGTVSRLINLTSETVTTLKITTKELFEESFLLEDPTFGYYADYIVITD
jgi:uncharacterized iron-regulated protein